MQQVHYWNIHNKVSIDQFITDLIRLGNSIISTMATAFHENQVIRAVIVTEQEKHNQRRSLCITEYTEATVITDKITFMGTKAYYKISGTNTGGWIEVGSIKSITTN